MKTKAVCTLIFLCSLIIAGCAPPKATFEISGSPDPLRYGGICGATVLTFTVTGPGDGLKINSIIVDYQLFDGHGTKISEAALHLNPVPDKPSVTYDASRIIVIPDAGGASSAPDELISDFGEGRVDFAATVYAKILSPSITGPDETYYFTSTKSIKVLPCLPVILIPPDILPTPTATAFIIPLPTKRPNNPPPPAPPSCSAEPNNPNCVP